MTGPTNPAAIDAKAVLAECRAYLVDQLASTVRNGGLRSPVAIAALREGAGSFFDDLVARGGASGFEGARHLTASKIKLVDDDQLEFAIALSAVAKDLAEHCGKDLSRLQLRMMTLLDSDRYEPASNPLGPETVCAGLDAACVEAGGNLQGMLALLDGLRRSLLVAMPLTYAGLDQLLVRRNVAARALPRAAADARAPVREAAAQGTALAALQSAVLGRMRAGVSSGAPGVVLDPAVAAVLLERALGELDAAQRALSAEAGPPAGATSGNLLRAMKSANALPQIGTAETAAFEVLSRVFDVIFDSPSLPDVVKTIIGRLQISLLKVSLLDPSFLTSPAHPARELVDGMARAAAGLASNAAANHPVCMRLRVIAAQVPAEFERDIGVFERAGAELRYFIAQQEQRAEADAGRYRALAERAERSALAAIDAARSLANLHAAQLPQTLRRFLAGDWTRVLAAIDMREGADSPSWQEHVDLARELVWSVQPKVEPDERKRLIASLPRLLSRLNAGLDSIGVSNEARAPLLDTFVGMHSVAMRGKSATTDDTTPSSVVSDIHVERIDAEDGSVLLVLSGESVSTAIDLAEGLAIGEWIELRLPDATNQRGRLSWISPVRGLCLFTNPAWKQAIALTPELLQTQLASGAARRLSLDSLFDTAAQRALRTLV